MRKQYITFLSPVLFFVVAMGIVSLFADMTYEGGASIHGLFLGKLGASAAVISIIGGVGEFLGYALRFPAGYVGDKTKHLWTLTFVGYGINLLAIPALALAGTWKIAACLMIAERIGRAIRKPSVDAMLSYTTNTLGKGWAYGFHTALDETGAMLGPLLVTAILLWKGKENFGAGYAALALPAACSLVALVMAQRALPHPAVLEKRQLLLTKGFTTSYWLTMLAGGCFAAGLAPFNKDSGAYEARRVICGGRRQAGCALFMASLSTSRFNPILSAFYKNLTQQGKPKKLALIAVARKLIIYLNHILVKNPKISIAY